MVELWHQQTVKHCPQNDLFFPGKNKSVCMASCRRCFNSQSEVSVVKIFFIIKMQVLPFYLLQFSSGMSLGKMYYIL